jgi:hypothetical protein
MYGYGAPPPKTDPPAKKWDGIARACIKKPKGDGSTAACGREVDERREFMFNDADRAVALYRDGKHLRACEACVGVIEEAKAREDGNLAPLATRKQENNQ